MSRSLRGIITAVALALPSAAIAQVQINQQFVPQGPSASVGVSVVTQSADAPPKGGVAGAVGPIVVDPANANIIYVGAVNGGVWKTIDGGTTWTALTDNQATLSISSLSLDPLDSRHQTLIAGTGLTSNGTVCDGCLAGNGGLRNGLLYSQDGGSTWRSLGATGTINMAGQTVAGVVARDNVIVAGTYEISGFASDKNTGALYRSTDGGNTFTIISNKAGSGLPLGAVSSLVGDPTMTNRLYAAVTAQDAAHNISTALYVSNDTGATWTKVFDSTNSAHTITSGSQTILRVATGPGGSIAVGVVDLGTGHGKVTGLFWSGDSGGTWTHLAQPPLSSPSLNQGSVNFAIAIDPNNKNLVYVSGDGLDASSINAVSAFRINASSPGTYTPITDANTNNNSTVHSDSRSIAIDKNGRLLLSSDGTIYARTNPQGDNGGWTRISGNLSAFQTYVVRYDAVGKRLITAAQDNGVTIQSGRNATQWNAIMGADGVNALVNDVTLAGSGQTAFYASYFNLQGMVRIVLDNTGKQISKNTPSPPGEYFPVGTIVTCGGVSCASAVFGASFPNGFSSPWVNNRIDPSRMAMAGTHVYVTQDTLTGTQDPSQTTVDLLLTDLNPGGGPNMLYLAFGTRNNPDMLLAAADGAHYIYQSTTATAGSLVSVNAYRAGGGDVPTGIVLDPRTDQRYYIADLSNIWSTTDQGHSFSKVKTTDLPASFTQPAAVEFISSNGVNALVVGGISNVANAQSPIVVGDSDNDGGLSNWRLFGNGLPNTQVSTLYYSEKADVLAVGTFGRGVFTLYDVTSYFPQATKLQFGLADNDSMPDASFLTDGTALDGSHFVRPLIKYGIGTLTIAGTATYTGGTTINDGALVLGNGGAGGSIIGNVTFCSSTIADPTCNTSSTAKSLVFNRSDSYTFGGSITGPGQVVQFGTGTTILTGASTYSGPTFIEGGTLLVHGSITSAVTVDGGGTLGGYGDVGDVTVNAGGVFAPGASVGTTTVHGNLIFNGGSVYLAEVQGNAADRIRVLGAATLGGTLAVSFLGGSLANHYTILTTTGGRTGTFDTLLPLNSPAFITTNVAYTSDAVQLSLTSGLTRIAGLTGNQSVVARVLDSTFNNGGGSLPGLGSVPAAQLPAALDAISGDGTAGTQQTAFGAANTFMSIMMDQGALWRSGAAIDVNGVTMTGEPLAYAMSGEPLAYARPSKSKSSEHPAFKAILKAPPSYQPRWRAWVTGFDGTWKLAGDVGLAGLNSNTGGLAGGMDYQFAPDVLLGFSLGGSSSNFSVRERTTSGHLDAAHFGGYGVKTWSSFYVAGALGFSTFRNDTSRTIAGAGPIQVATGSFGSNLLSGRLEVGSKQSFARFAVTPFAAVQVAELWQNGYTETAAAPPGGGTLALGYAAHTATSLPTFLGAQVDSRVLLPYGIMMAPYTRLSWVHEFSPIRQVSPTFVALPGTAFTVDGPRAARDAAKVELGTKFAVSKAKGFVSFDGEFSNRSQAYAGKAGVNVPW